MSTKERSASRGRGVVLQSSGRGGAGNIRPPSQDRQVEDDHSDPRGRDPIPAGDPNVVISTARGGRGNIRSPSRDASHPDNASADVSLTPSERRGRGYDRDLITSIDDAQDNGLCTPNSARSRSRTTGRGGVGNIHLGGPDIEELDEPERASHQHEPGVHSVARGGYGNVTSGELPHSEGAVNPHGADHPHATHTHNVESTGRGGMGNIPLTRASLGPRTRTMV